MSRDPEKMWQAKQVSGSQSESKETKSVTSNDAAFSFLFIRIKMIKGKTQDKVISRCLIHNNQHSCKIGKCNTIENKTITEVD